MFLSVERALRHDLETPPALVQWKAGPQTRGSRMPDAIKSMVVNGVTIEAVEHGSGRPILFLHPGIGIDPAAPVLLELAKGGRVIAPSHPGFGTSQLPKAMTTVDDVTYFYLDLLEALEIEI